MIEPVTIGPCQLYLGDCREVLAQLPSGSVDAVVTDPPFGIGFMYGDEREISDDPQAYGAFLLPIIHQCRMLAKPGAFFAVWQAQLNYRHFWTWFGDDIRIYCSSKNFVQLRNTPINYAYDPTVMWYQGGKPLRPDSPPRNVDFHVGNTAAVVSDTTRPERGHPCPRPLDTVREVVENFTLPDGTVIDPFLGSGTTAVACVQTGRSFVGIEQRPEYFEIACHRVRKAVNEDRESLYPRYSEERSRLPLEVA